VFVLGAHRSGTSAVARLINLLGVPLCRDGDLMPAGEGNPAGHWESRSLARRNEQLLHLLGAAWDCPPAAESGVGDRLLAGVRPGPVRAAFRRSFGADRWAWKDPRLCVLLPFWRAVLPGQHSVVLVARHPLDVAASLASRNGLERPHALAVWERYLRSALVGCSGLPVLVVSQPDLVDDPRRVAADIRAFLAAQGLAPGRAIGAAAASVDPRLRHHVADPGAQGLNRYQRRLWRQLCARIGEHAAFEAPNLGLETPGLDAYFAPRRSFWGWVAPEVLPVNASVGLLAPYEDEDPRGPQRTSRPGRVRVGPGR
jgi:hypothetical protein